MPQLPNSTFRADLDTAAPVEPDFRDEEYDSRESNGADLGKAVGTVFEAIAPKAPDEESVLGQYASEASDIVGQTEGYADQRQRLLQGLAATDPNDKKALENLYGQFESLRNGELQGRMSPMRSAALINMKTKEYLNRYPHLATKIRALRGGFMEDIPRVAGAGFNDVDPDTAALENIATEARQNGFSMKEQIGLNSAKANDVMIGLQLSAKNKLGELAEADIGLALVSKGNTVYKALLPGLANHLKDPNFSGKDVLAQLQVMRANLLSQSNEAMMRAQVDYKMNLSKEFQTGTLAQVLGPLDQLIEMSKTLDNPGQRALLSDQLRKINENGDIESFRNAFGSWITIFRGTEYMWPMIQDLHKISGQLKAGLGSTLDTVARNDPKTAYLLSVVRSPGFNDILADAIIDTDSNKPHDTSGNKTLDDMRCQTSISAAMRVGVPPAKQEEMLSCLAQQTNAFEAWDKRKDVALRTKQYPKTVETLHRTGNKLLAQEATQADQNSVGRIQFNALNKVSPFSIPDIPTQATGPRVDPQTGEIGFGAGIEYVDPNAYALVQRLNQQYRVFSNYMGSQEIMKWGATTLDEIKTSKVPGFNPADTVKAPAPTAAIPTVNTPTDVMAGLSPEEIDWANQPAVEAPAKTPSTTTPGLIEPGNINLDKRVKVDNEDGTFSTLKSITIEEDGRYILIPSLNPIGEQLSDDDAITLFHYTGQHLGVFATQQAADLFASRLSKYMGTKGK